MKFLSRLEKKTLVLSENSKEILEKRKNISGFCCFAVEHQSHQSKTLFTLLDVTENIFWKEFNG